METTEQYLAEMLSKFPDDKAILIIRNGNMSNVGPTKESDVRATAKQNNLPFFETSAFVALGQYDGLNDQMIYRVVRK